METETIIQKFISQHIKSMTIEKRGEKFYGTLTDKEGRTFEYNKEISDIRRQFFASHVEIPADEDILRTMIMKQFQIIFVGVYQSKKALGDLGTSSTI